MDAATLPDSTQRQRVSEFFDASKQWQGDLYTARDDYFARVIRRRKEYAFSMLRRLGDLTGKKVLDIGCGSGTYLEGLLTLGADAHGMDFSHEMLTVCSRLGGDAGSDPRLHLVGGDVERIPFRSGTFDLILCVGVFGYLLTDETALAEIRRVLKPGGVLLLNLTNMYSLSDVDFVLRTRLRSLFHSSPRARHGLPSASYAMQSPWMLKHRKYFFKSYNPWKYERILAGDGFRRMDAMTYGFEFRVLRRLRIVPESALDALELLLEGLVRRFSIPYLSYAGWVYTGLFQREESAR